MMTMVWPSDFSISPATSRVIWSVEPPAAQGTIRLIGRTGFQSAACAGRDKRLALMAEKRTAARMPGYLTRRPPSSCFCCLRSEQQNYPLCAQEHNMAWLDSNVNIPPHRQRLHRRATRDQMLVAPAEVNLR